MFTLAPPLRAAGLGRDPYRASLKLLMHADGADGGTTFTDDSPSARTLTASGATTSKAQVKFGTTSALADTAGDDIGIASNSDLLFDGVFTLSFWLYLNALPPDARYFMGDSSSGSNYFQLASSGALTVTSNGTHACGTLTAGAWQHIEVSQTAGATYSFLNGALQSASGSAVLIETGPKPRGIFKGTSLPAEF